MGCSVNPSGRCEAVCWVEKVKGERLKVEKKEGEKVKRREKAELSILGKYNYWITNENT
jgi:hypothetical protein